LEGLPIPIPSLLLRGLKQGAQFHAWGLRMPTTFMGLYL
jgi:hypothetical protein